MPARNNNNNINMEKQFPLSMFLPNKPGQPKTQDHDMSPPTAKDDVNTTCQSKYFKRYPVLFL